MSDRPTNTPVPSVNQPSTLERLIETLGLVPHPEGGRFREIFRSTATVDPGDGRSRRAALTSIYYLLRAGEISRWHRVRSDEAWHFCDGGALDVFVAPPDLSGVESRRLGPGDEPRVTIVPAGWWQAARPLGDYALTGCTVAPGFVFEDFEFLRDVAGERERFEARFPDYCALV